MEQSSALRTKVYLFWVRQQGKSGYGGLFAVILREICGYIGDYIVLTQLHSSYFRWFSVAQRQWSPHISISAPFRYSREGRYITFHSNQLLYTGGLRKIHIVAGKALSEVWAITLSGAGKQLPSMQTGRYMHGLAVYRRVLYVFGGLGVDEEGEERYIKSCERLVLNDATVWAPLPDQIHHRVCYNPCIWLEKIWLCGGRSPTIEVFTPATLSFRSLSLPFPDNGPTLVFTMRNNLVIFSRRSAVTLTEEQGQVRAQSSTSLLGKFEPTMEIAAYKDLAWVMQNDKCVALDGFSGITVEIAK